MKNWLERNGQRVIIIAIILCMLPLAISYMWSSADDSNRVEAIQSSRQALSRSVSVSESGKESRSESISESESEASSISESEAEAANESSSDDDSSMGLVEATEKLAWADFHDRVTEDTDGYVISFVGYISWPIDMLFNIHKRGEDPQNDPTVGWNYIQHGAGVYYAEYNSDSKDYTMDDTNIVDTYR